MDDTKLIDVDNNFNGTDYVYPITDGTKSIMADSAKGLEDIISKKNNPFSRFGAKAMNLQSKKTSKLSDYLPKGLMNRPYGNTRDTKFKTFGPFSDFFPKGSLNLYYGENPQIKLFEAAIAEFNQIELASRPKYNSRCNEVMSFVREQIRCNDNKPDTFFNNPKKLSTGVEELLRTANSFIQTADLKMYKSVGCDIADSLLDYISISRANENVPSTGKELSDMYHTLVTTGKCDRITSTPELARYAAENAVKAIRAFVSIAEYERFKGGRGSYGYGDGPKAPQAACRIYDGSADFGYKQKEKERSIDRQFDCGFRMPKKRQIEF